MNTNQIYNKTITISHQNEELDTFNLNYLTYKGKLTAIVEYFNKLSIENCTKIAQKNNEGESALDIAAYLGFTNIYLYLLTFSGDPYKLDERGRNSLYYSCYKGELKIIMTLLNFERFRIKMESLQTIDVIKKSYKFSKLDIVKGKLSRAVNLTELNVKRFNSFQVSMREEAQNIIKKALLKLEIALSQRDMEGRTPLHYAAMSKFPLCYLIVESILDFEFFNLNGWDDFLRLYSDIQFVEVKEERKCDPRRSLRLERELATLLGETIIKELFQEFRRMKGELMKSIINMQDNMGNTVLHVAAFHGDYRIVNKLLAYGADKIAINGEDKIAVDLAKDNFVRNVLTSLNKAAKSSDEKNITELVYFGHDINKKQTIFSQAPIHKVIESNKEDKYNVLIKMLDMGADPNSKDSNGWAALHYASEFGDFESVKILIASKAVIDFFSNNHRTPLHLAALNNFPEILKFLLENNADPNFKDNNGCTPLHLASKHGNVTCIDLLLAYGAFLYEVDFRKWNVLHYAAFQGHHKAVRYLIKYDADYDILQTNRNSQNKLAIEIVRDPSVKPNFISLWHAAREGDLDMIRQLLNEGEKINEQTIFLRNTPIHIAVLNNHYLTVRLLLNEKANFELRNKDEITPVEYAEIMNAAITRFADKCENIINDTIDLRDFVRNILNKSDKILNNIISTKNYKIRIWFMNDFTIKIVKLFRGEEETRNENSY
jgi:ankyrin repeat protein